MASQLLLESVRGFFEVQENFDVLYSLRNRGRADHDLPSLRVIDHLVTRFARERGVCYDVPGNDIPMHLYLAHRAELDRYGKAHIDPFARSDKRITGQAVLESPDGDGRRVNATAKQLNFIRWAIRNRVIEYAAAFLPQIRANLPPATKKRRGGTLKQDREPVAKRPKPTPLVRHNTRIHTGDFRVSFDFRDHRVPDKKPVSAPGAK